MVTSQPQFKVGDRVFSHYVMDWGTVELELDTRRGDVHGVTGSPMPDTTWYKVRMDKSKQTEMLDDAHGAWDEARIVPPRIAKRYGYGDDPREGVEIENAEKREWGIF
jgi:hypothetical protein